MSFSVPHFPFFWSTPMGMHLGLIAAKTSVDKFRQAFPRIWTEYEVVAEESFPDPKTAMDWAEMHEDFVSAADWSKDNRGKEVYVFLKNGPWAIMQDESYCLASDDGKLKILSDQVGLVLSFIIE